MVQCTDAAPRTTKLESKVELNATHVAGEDRLQPKNLPTRESRKTDRKEVLDLVRRAWQRDFAWSNGRPGCAQHGANVADATLESDETA